MTAWLLKFFAKKLPKGETSKSLLESELTYIRSENLEQGMYVEKSDRPWLDSPFKFQGFNIKTERELKMLRNSCY